jgi:hypothetical protein
MFQNKDISVGEWFVFYFLSAIPGINLVVWLFLLLSGNTNKSLKNLLVLQVILAAVVLLGTILFWGMIIGSVSTT